MDYFFIFFQLLSLNFEAFVNSLNQMPIFISWLIFLFLCFFIILLFLKFFGKEGIYVYTSIAVIVANIQVLKIVDFPIFDNPIALGTILFSTTFLSTDILTEYFGAKYAKKNIFISFASFLVMTIFMLFTIGFKPVDPNSLSSDYAWALSIQDNLLNIFMPFPIFFISSMISFLISQYFDVWFYERISKITKKRFIWIRNNVSTMCSGLLDNTVFSLFAWIILNPDPLNFNTVLFTFILGTYFLRIIIAIFDTPIIYLAKYFLPNKNNE